MTTAADLPQEAIETLRAISTGEPGITLDEPILNLLVKQGYVESVDGVPALTDSGTDLLNSTEETVPDFLSNTH